MRNSRVLNGVAAVCEEIYAPIPGRAEAKLPQTGYAKKLWLNLYRMQSGHVFALFDGRRILTFP